MKSIFELMLAGGVALGLVACDDPDRADDPGEEAKETVEALKEQAKEKAGKAERKLDEAEDKTKAVGKEIQEASADGTALVESPDKKH